MQVPLSPDFRCACRDTWQCSSWLMCEDDKGCLDGTGNTIGKHMCQLRDENRKPWGIPQAGQHLVLPSNFASGYVKSEHPSGSSLGCSCAPGWLLSLSGYSVLSSVQSPLPPGAASTGHSHDLGGCTHARGSMQ